MPHNRRISRIPIGRFGRAEDIVYAALYLASDESSWTTGTSFVVDAGITVNYFCEPEHAGKEVRE